METMEKPRLKYSPEHFAARASLGYQEGTVALLVQKYIEEAKQPGSRPIGLSKGCTLRRWQHLWPIGGKQQGTLRVLDLMDHGKRRKAEGVKPPTVLNDIATLGAVLRHAVEVWEMAAVEADLATLKKAKKQLEKNQLVAKSIPRDRLPTDEEETLLRDFFVQKGKHHNTKIDMGLVMDGEFTTGRRISELCRIERQHVNVQARTCLIFDLKNAKGKGFHGEFALIEGAWELFERRLNEIPQEPTAKLFPFNAKSCGQAYTKAKKKLAELHPGLFKNLRMHDNRAECFVRLLDKGYSAVQVQKGVSLHKDLKTLVGSYVRIKAIDLHKGPAAQQQREQSGA